MSRPIIIVHGGAWTIPDALVDDSKKGIIEAARAGYQVLKPGGTALEAVEAAIVSMENNQTFDAGKGSVLTRDETIEMDSMIMDGKTLKAGSVACVNSIANPIKLARLVMDKTDHVMLVGEGANKFAREMGVPKVATDSLLSPYAREEFEQFKREGYGSTVSNMFKKRTGHETVGAVAVDSHGNLAAGTSTGGITAKRPGRVGDTPLIGCGGYADNTLGGVSITGHGEGIAKVCLARHITFLIDQGLSAQAACEKALENMDKRVGSSGGAIVIDKKGNIGHAFTTDHMTRAWAKDGQIYYGVDLKDIMNCPA